MSRIIGYASGVFDLFHIGHLNVLKHASAQCDYLVAGVLTDEAAGHKGHAPVVPLHERLEIVRSMAYVDEAIVDNTLEKMEAWRQVGFHRLFKGEDWKGTARGAQWERDFAAVGVEVVYVPYTMHVSSTKLRQMIHQLISEGRR
ncbi:MULTISPECIES: adenylyltransferase/cytidyltransferase family protein [Streptomyces]|uniref:adenylyltransferase/cytidyltransferase family protein n=1 Tax=Streptomyces TaxID=1883 RepID=UPI001316219C|nr:MULTISPECIES: adenylyltransferase/cytidyltransferase family protein [Streptomyces]QGZ52079.1 adenylyltransferase/cytidyltransferase family protein [Streptomyces sp. QHH-9511]GGT73071.1 cytidyltransferase [Streptomyces lateritius]